MYPLDQFGTIGIGQSHMQHSSNTRNIHKQLALHQSSHIILRYGLDDGSSQQLEDVWYYVMAGPAKP